MKIRTKGPLIPPSFLTCFVVWSVSLAQSSDEGTDSEFLRSLWLSCVNMYALDESPYMLTLSTCKWECDVSLSLYWLPVWQGNRSSLSSFASFEYFFPLFLCVYWTPSSSYSSSESYPTTENHAPNMQHIKSHAICNIQDNKPKKY